MVPTNCGRMCHLTNENQRDNPCASRGPRYGGGFRRGANRELIMVHKTAPVIDGMVKEGNVGESFSCGVPLSVHAEVIPISPPMGLV